MTTTPPTSPIFNNEENCVCYNDIKYPLAKIGQIIARDIKQQEYKRKAYKKWQTTDKGKSASRRANRKYYHKKSLKLKAEKENIPPEENPSD
jgi:hypothetical protein